MKDNELIEKIKAHLAVEGNVVQVTTYLRSTVYEAKHRELFVTSLGGAACVKTGRKSNRLDDISGCQIRFGAWKIVKEY